MRDYNYQIEWSYIGEFGNRFYGRDIFYHYTSARYAVREVVDDYMDYPGFQIEQVHREDPEGWVVIDRFYWED